MASGGSIMALLRFLVAAGLLLTILHHSGAQDVIPIGRQSIHHLSINLSDKLLLCVVNPSGAIFEVGTDEMQAAFRHAVAQFNRMNESASGRRYELQAFVDIISTADTVKLSKLSKLPQTAPSSLFVFTRPPPPPSCRARQVKRKTLPGTFLHK